MKENTKKWMTVAGCFLMIMLALGFTSSTKSLFPDEIAKAIGQERSLVSINESCRYIATAVVNLFFGALIARFGAKKLIVAGFISLVASMFLFSVAQNLALIYVAGALLGIGLSWTTTTMIGYLIGKWCTSNKGTMMGIVLASNGLGGAIAIQAAGALINPEVVGSYRDAYRMIGIVVAVTAVLVVLLVSDKKTDSAEPVKEKKKARGQEWTGIEWKKVLKSWYFWGVIVCIFFSGMILQGTHGIVAMHYKDVGIDYATVKGLLSFGSILLATAKFLTGFLYDKTGLRITASICIGIAVISCIMLSMVKGTQTGFVLAVAYSAISPYALPLETIMLPIYANDLFGKMSYSNVLGIFVSANTAGYALGAPLLNLCYDKMGSYVPGLVAVSIIMIIMLVLLQFVVSAAHKERKKVMELEENNA